MWNLSSFFNWLNKWKYPFHSLKIVEENKLITPSDWWICTVQVFSWLVYYMTLNEVAWSENISEFDIVSFYFCGLCRNLCNKKARITEHWGFYHDRNIVQFIVLPKTSLLAKFINILEIKMFRVILLWCFKCIFAEYFTVINLYLFTIHSDS